MLPTSTTEFYSAFIFMHARNFGKPYPYKYIFSSHFLKISLWKTRYCTFPGRRLFTQRFPPHVDALLLRLWISIYICQRSPKTTSSPLFHDYFSPSRVYKLIRRKITIPPSYRKIVQKQEMTNKHSWDLKSKPIIIYEQKSSYVTVIKKLFATRKNITINILFENYCPKDDYWWNVVEQCCIREATFPVAFLWGRVIEFPRIRAFSR